MTRLQKYQLALILAGVFQLVVFVLYTFKTASPGESIPPGAAVLAAAIILVGFFSYLLARAYEKNRTDSEKLIRELRESNSLLAAAKAGVEEELKIFKDNQDKIYKNAAELFTLQMVSDTVNSTLELNRLLNTVNDIIIGIMGVNSCSICIFEESREDIRYLVTNEKRKHLVEKIRTRALRYLHEDHDPNEEIPVEEVSGFNPVTKISLTPVIKNKYILGVIITGHTENNLFSSEDVRFMKSVCNQISMAIENAMLYEKLSQLANTDHLTGIYNRAFFQKSIERIISGDDGQYPVAVAMLDVDDFKAINDRYGHDAGDTVLVGISALIRSMIRKDDTFVRYGGEEFLLIMQKITIEKSLERLNQIRKKIENNSFAYNGQSLSITVSIGVAYLEKSGETPDALIKKADQALYAAKKKGKNRIEVYNNGIGD
ncbi:MAG: sensor domain-containing diguanylate cyclase [Peptococcaceae bacterium]|nr:sensor domain-containing diguanylate cyclase [Peptococcaceae bacterium]